MIAPRSYSELLARSLMGLGGIGDSMTETDKAKAAIAAEQAGTANTQAQTVNTQAALPGIQAESGIKQASFAAEMKKRQLLDALNKGPGATQPAMGPGSIGDTAARSWNPSSGNEPTPGLGTPSAGTPDQGMPDDHANLIASLMRENGQPDATPEMVKAKYQSGLTQAKNAGTMSNLDVTGKQTENETNAFALGQQQKLGPLKEKQAQATVENTQAEAEKNRAEAALKNKMAENGGNTPQEIASIEKQAKTRFDNAGKETGFDTVKGNWGNIQSAYADTKNPKIKDLGPSDYSILDQYLKMVNPGASVRSSNMEMFANSMSLPDKLKTQMLKVQKGGKFDPDVRDAIVDLAGKIYANHENAYMEKLRAIDEGLSATSGANRERVFGKSLADKLTGAAGGQQKDPLGIFQ